jgi:beta-ketodecanoyl-[acyl-carrier-protein] synthase
LIQAAIAATGLYTPPHSISNDELMLAYNTFVERFNDDNRADIERGVVEKKSPSSAEFVREASGIQSRFVLDKSGILDPERMAPSLPWRSNEELSITAEMGVRAAEQALERWGKPRSKIDLVLCAASNMQRAYPAMAIEIQHALGLSGAACDINVACSSAVFGIKAAEDAIRSGSARAVLMLNPEVCTAHLNFRDRDSHFIFGDVATAVLLERADEAPKGAFAVLGSRLLTSFSNNIRNNFGFLNRTETRAGGERRPNLQAASPYAEARAKDDLLFTQQGRKVFKDVVPMVSELVLSHAKDVGVDPTKLKRLWLHQANQKMNDLIAKRILGREPSAEESVTILDTYANTSSAGSVIAFHSRSSDLTEGDCGLLCSFGAGYSAGSVFLRKT